MLGTASTEHIQDRDFFFKAYQDFFTLVLRFDVDSSDDAVIGVGEQEEFVDERRNAFALAFETEPGAAFAEGAWRGIFGVVGGDTHVIASTAICATARMLDAFRQRRLHLKIENNDI